MNHTKTSSLPAPHAPRFEVAAASVAGRDHLRAGRNNQDAFSLWRGAFHLCAVIADGCGAAPHSEVGARLGARMLVNALARRLEPGPEVGAGDGASGTSGSIEALLEEARRELLDQLGALARGLAGSGDERALAAAVRDHLLFTLVGALVGPGGAVLFSIGDGALALEGEEIALGPFGGNEPPYLGYALLPERLHGFPEDALRFSIAARPPAPRTIALGSDGALDLFAATPPALLAADPLLFHNPDALRRKLWLLAQRAPGDGGAVLRDDTTLVLLRATAGEA